MNENLKTKTNPTMIQQTIHKSMFTKTRSNSLGTLPQDINPPEISFSANDPNKNTWQQDRIPQAKRKRVENKSPQTENIKKKSNTPTYAIPTHNQFDVLDDEEAATDNKETEKPPKPEPIFVTGVLDINALRNKLKEITTTDDYTMTTLRSGHIVKIMPANIEKYKSIREKFISDNISHYTYMLKSERPYRVVLRGLHSSEDTTEINETLKHNGHEVRQIVNVRHRTSKEPLPLFYVDLEPKSNNRDIFNLKYLNHMKVTFEPPYKKKEIIQCKRCQRFGHSKNQCHRPFRCVKCGEDHPTSTCKKTKDSVATCANCQQKHPASYRGCVKYKQYKEHILKIQPKATRANVIKRQTRKPEVDIPQTNNNTLNKNTPTYAEATKTKTNNTTNSNEPVQMQQLEDILDKMFNRMQTMMINMVDNMMDRFIQLVGSLKKI